MRTYEVVFIACLAVGLSVPARADTPTAASPPGTRAPAPALMEPSRHLGSDLVIYALGLLGVNYKYGGDSIETGLDCSGFVRYVFGHAAGLDLPHSAYAMSRLGHRISRDNLKPGDLVFFRTLRKAFSHVGIYLGQNRFIDAPRPGQTVRIEDITDTYWARRFEEARRLLAPKSADASNRQRLSGIR